MVLSGLTTTVPVAVVAVVMVSGSPSGSLAAGSTEMPTGRPPIASTGAGMPATGACSTGATVIATVAPAVPPSPSEMV